MRKSCLIYLCGTSHNSTVPSVLALAIVRPSGLKLTSLTTEPCPAKILNGSIAATSQTVAVPFLLALATMCPSGLKSTFLTQPPVAPFSVFVIPIIPIGWRCTLLCPPVTIVLPFGAKLTPLPRLSVMILECFPVPAFHN